MNFFSKIKAIPNLRCFFLLLQWLLNYQHICDFSLNKSCKTYQGPMMPPVVNFTDQLAHCTSVPALSKLYKRCRSASPTFLPKFNGLFQATTFAMHAIFWCIFAKCCCHQKYYILYEQELLCFGTKMLVKFTPGWWQKLAADSFQFEMFLLFRT